MTNLTLLVLGGAAFLALTLMWAVLPQLQRRRRRPARPPGRKAAAPLEGIPPLPAADGRLPVALRNGQPPAYPAADSGYLCELGLPGLQQLRIPIRRQAGRLPGYAVDVLGVPLERGNLSALREDLGGLLAGLVRGGSLPSHLLALEGQAQAWPVYEAAGEKELAIPQGPIFRGSTLEALLQAACGYLRALRAGVWVVYRVDPESLALEAPLAMVAGGAGAETPLPLYADGPDPLSTLAGWVPAVAHRAAGQLARALRAEASPSGHRLALPPGEGQGLEALRWRGFLVALEGRRGYLARDLWELGDMVAAARGCPPEWVTPTRSRSGSSTFRILQEA